MPGRRLLPGRGDVETLFDSLRGIRPEFCREHQHLPDSVVAASPGNHFGLADANFARLADGWPWYITARTDVRHFAPEDELLKTM